MPKNALTDEEKMKNRVERETKIFIKNVRNFLTAKNGGEMPDEWELSMKLLETYYRQFLMATIELEQADSLLIMNHYGLNEHPLLKIQSRAATRLEKCMETMGLSLKSATKLKIAEPKKEESPLEMFVKDKVEKRG